MLRCALVGLPMALAGCSAMDTDLSPAADDGQPRFTIGVVARDEAAATRGPANPVGTEVGSAGEYIHNLCVLIVDADGLVAWKSNADELQYDTQAQNGNLRSWRSELITDLAPGKYTVYAFANINSYFDALWSSLTGIGLGVNIHEIEVDGEPFNIDDLALQDPAGKIDFSQKYFIPMSARQDVTITPATTSVSIGLDRLVSKVRITISGASGAKVTALSFGGYADVVYLFSTGGTYNDTFGGSKEVALPEGGLQLSGTATQAPEFYVNSNDANIVQGYEVNLTTDEKNGITYTAFTQLSQLPRNSIFPLLLQLNDFALQFSARCWLSPIGAPPTEVAIEPLNDVTYSLRIPEGSQFEIDLQNISAGTTGATGISCTWSFDADAVPGIAFEDYQPGSTVVKGHVTASAGRTFPLTCEASWVIDNTVYRRTYTIIIETDDIFTFDFDTSSNAAQNRFGLLWLNTEMLNMSRH